MLCVACTYGEHVTMLLLVGAGRAKGSFSPSVAKDEGRVVLPTVTGSLVLWGCVGVHLLFNAAPSADADSNFNVVLLFI